MTSGQVSRARLYTLLRFTGRLAMPTTSTWRRAAPTISSTFCKTRRHLNKTRGAQVCTQGSLGYWCSAVACTTSCFRSENMNTQSTRSLKSSEPGVSRWGAARRWSDEFNDLIYGDAGTVLFLSYVAEQTANAEALDLATQGCPVSAEPGTRCCCGVGSGISDVANLLICLISSHGTAGRCLCAGNGWHDSG